MSYRTEKIAQEKQKKRIRSIAVGALCALVAAACVFSAFVPAESWKYYFDLPRIQQKTDGELRAHFMDVENGNCVLIELPDGKNVLVGGGANDGEARKNVFRFLNALKIKTIDMLVVPNAAANGVGILRELVRFYDVKQACLPMKTGTNAEYSAFVADLSRKGIPAYTAKSGLLMGGEEGYALRVLLPFESGLSVTDTVLSLSYRGVDFLFGDEYTKDSLSLLLTERELGLWDKWGIELDNFEIVQSSARIDAELYSSFATAFACESVIFSCRGGEGHTPKEEVLTELSGLGVNAYRTDLNGYVTVSVHGENEYVVTTQK